jgi:hypothetical protein
MPQPRILRMGTAAAAFGFKGHEATAQWQSLGEGKWVRLANLTMRQAEGLVGRDFTGKSCVFKALHKLGRDRAKMKSL